MTAGGGAVTGGGDAPARSPGAIRQARYRERRREAARLTEELARQGREEARQAGLPLAPVTEQEDAPPEPIANGRPAGSVARSTAEWQRYMLTRYRSPLVVLAETYSRPLADLAEELGCTKLEAFDRQLRAAADLAPYLHSKMPVAMQVDSAPMVPVVLSVSPEMAARMGVAGTAQDQGVSGGGTP